MGFISKPIFSRLAKRFQIRQAASEQLESGQVLVPITNADELVRERKEQVETATATNKTSNFTVPLGKLWRVWIVSVEREQADGTNYTYLNHPNGDSIMIATTPTSKTHFQTFYGGLPVQEGWTVQVIAGTGTSGGITNAIYYEEEDA